MVVRSSISSLVLKEKTHIEYWEFFVIEYLIRHTLACRKLCTVTNLLIKEKTLVITLNGNYQCYQLCLFWMPKKFSKPLSLLLSFFLAISIFYLFFPFSGWGWRKGLKFRRLPAAPLHHCRRNFVSWCLG